MKSKALLSLITAFAIVAAARELASAQIRGYEVGTIVSIQGPALTLRSHVDGHLFRANVAFAERDGTVHAALRDGNTVRLGGHWAGSVFEAENVYPAPGGAYGYEVGTVVSVTGNLVTLTSARDHRPFRADISRAQNAGRAVALHTGEPVQLGGFWNGGVFQADSVKADYPITQGYEVGTIRAVHRFDMTLVADNGHVFHANIAFAERDGTVHAPLTVGNRVRVFGHWMNDGIFYAENVYPQPR